MSHLLESSRVYPPNHHGDNRFEAACMWFARCGRPANGVADAGPAGPTPICRRCAEHAGITEFIVGGVE